MEIEDFFENKQKHHRQNEHGDYRNDHQRHENHSHGGNHDDYLMQMLARLKNDPKLKLLLIVGFVVVIVLVVALIIALLPFLSKIWDTVAKSGLQEFINGILK